MNQPTYSPLCTPARATLAAAAAVTTWSLLSAVAWLSGPGTLEQQIAAQAQIKVAAQAPLQLAAAQPR